MSDKKFRKGFILGVVSAAILVIGIGAGIYFAMPKDTTVSEMSAKKMTLMEQLVDAYYFGKIDKSKMTEGTYKGLIEGLDDPYSEYFTKEEYKDLQQESSGKYVGIGALVTQDDKNGIISIVKVLDKSPAKKAGLKKDDIIAQVDGKDVTGKELTKVVSKMKGKEDTKVTLKILDPKTAKYKTVTLVRKSVDSPSVDSKIIDKKNNIGYIAISEFDQNTAEQFEKHIKKLKKKKVKGIIFDLRYNPGGLYDTVVKMLDDILPEGVVVFTKDKNGNREEEKSDAKCLKLPIVVLQNEGSASAAEIFSGAIQDFKAGTIVGTKSYGKGVVQNTFPFSDGSALKLTIKKYYTPSGKNINGKGITPDVKVENDAKTDKQLNVAKSILAKKIK
ncbi:MAG: S41 family peptidase [Eubacterium sp.]|nr:S41 family peptidase [Eubacterium sp.]